jgi:flagellar secretion chaperone FliS
MQATIRDLYLETEVTTATPQRLRLMLIEEALRQARRALDASARDEREEAAQATTRCRDLVSELLAGVQPEQAAVAKEVLRVYLFVYSTLMEVEFGGDYGRLEEIALVLAEEQGTWQAVCQQFPDRTAKTATGASGEELAPARVAQGFDSAYGESLSAAAHVGLSLDA